MRAAVITISDRSFNGERADQSGPALVKLLEAEGWKVIQQQVLPDNFMDIRDSLVKWSDCGDFDLILTTGGTGFSARDITPEATSAVVERDAPGLVEAMRAASLEITPHAMLSRAVAGIRRKTLIVNLPGSPKGAIENIEVILPVLPHAVELLRNAPDSEKGHIYK